MQSTSTKPFSYETLPTTGVVAYYSMEIAIDPEIHTYSGGLGILAGDTLRSAADLIKQAMIHIDARIRRENRPCRMLLQIHDELLFETPQAAAESDRDMIREVLVPIFKRS